MSAETHATGLSGQDRTSDKPPRRCFIYAIRERESGRQYVGSAVDFKDRWRHHKWLLNANRHHCAYLQNAWRKYGRDRFEFLILEELPSNDPEPRRIAEVSWIAKSQYYNSLMPGQGRDHFTADEVLRMRISASHKHKLLTNIKHASRAKQLGVALKAFVQSPEGRKCARDNATRRWQDPIEREILLQGLINRWAKPDAKIRQSMALKKARGTPEARQRNSEIMKKRWANPSDPLHNRRQTRWANPEARKRQSEKMRAYHASKH